MRKQIVGIAVLTLLVALNLATASAQVNITLGQPSSGSAGNVTFTGTATGTDNLTFGTCGAGTNCWSGNTTGSAGGSPVSSPWAIDFSTAVPVTMNASGLITQGGGAALTIGGGSLLTGSLQLVSLGQLGYTGVYNYDLVANLTSLGGSLAQYFSNGTGVTQITIDFSSNTQVVGLPNLTTVTGTYSTGSLTTTPEPSSLLLMGSGLMMFGGVLRRKLLS